MADSSPVTIVQCSEKHVDKVYYVNVISNPLQTTLTPWEQFCFGMLDLARREGWK